MNDQCTPSLQGQRPLSRLRRYLLVSGTVLLLCVYYLNYGVDFHEGSSEVSSGMVTPLRLVAIALIVGSLSPFRLRFSASWLLILLYVLGACSFLLTVGFSGELNDLLFVNTLIQLPVLWALCHTKWHLDYARWLRLIGTLLVVQSLADLAVLLSGESLWISQAFVGGVGNPSSFGISCVILLTFNLFHPQAGRYRALKVVALALAALMSKSLFAVLGIASVYSIWTLRSRWRLIGALIPVFALLLGVRVWLSTHDEEIFILHKLSAAAAVVGLMDYDSDTSATVSARSEMHQRTIGAIVDQPVALIFGHLEGKPYWPMDSQVLTYLGSFGLLLLAPFLLLHLMWMFCAASNRRSDGSFTLISLGLFGLIFFTNRILDYFPVATLYFLCISMAISKRDTDLVHAPANNGLSCDDRPSDVPLRTPPLAHQ